MQIEDLLAMRVNNWLKIYQGTVLMSNRIITVAVRKLQTESRITVQANC